MKETLGKLCSKNVMNNDLWIYAAQKFWEIEDIESARTVFLKGIAINKNPKILVEFFRLECLYCEKLNKINIEIGIEDEDNGDLERGEVAFVVFEELLSLKDKDLYLKECIEISKVVPTLYKKINERIEKL